MYAQLNSKWQSVARQARKEAYGLIGDDAELNDDSDDPESLAAAGFSSATTATFTSSSISLV
jgi:hypothetical protein